MLLRHISRLGVLAILLVSTVALADTNPRFTQKIAQNQGQGGGQRGKMQFMQELGLSSEQVSQIQAIQSKYKGQISQRRQALKQAQADLENLIAGTASADEIRQQHKQVQSLRQQIEEAQFTSLLEVRQVMTPEQRSKYVQLMQTRRRASALKHIMGKKTSQN